MDKKLFDSMQEQMKPGPEVRAALEEKLAQTAKKRPVVWKKYMAVAACAALAVSLCGAAVLSEWDEWRAFAARFMKGHPNAVYQEGADASWGIVVDSFGPGQHLHSYVVVDGLTGQVPEDTYVASTGTGSDSIRDQDMGMAPDDLAQAMLDVGYTQEEIDEYQSIGYQMTWAKWWKFVGQQQNSEGDDPFNMDDLRIFSQKELYVNTGALPAPNTGDLPGGAYVGDIPVQEGAEDYQRLMDHFNGTYPDWYGGAYLDDSGWLVVLLVESEDPADKSLELQVLDWTGSDQVMFASAKYSLTYLHGLMDQLNALPEADSKCREVMAGWGVDEQANHIELTLTQVDDHVLSILAELDPEDDAIYVQVGQRASADVGEGEDVTTDSARTEDPTVYHVMPGGATVPDVPDDEGLIAYEPYYDGAHYDVEDLPAQLPESKLPALVDSVPEEDVPARTEDASTAAYDPGA